MVCLPVFEGLSNEEDRSAVPRISSKMGKRIEPLRKLGRQSILGGGRFEVKTRKYFS